MLAEFQQRFVNGEARASRHPSPAAGVVTHRQRPATASGVTFLNLEDETGFINVIVSPGCWARHRKIARDSSALIVRGRLERANGVTNLIAERIEKLPLAARTASETSGEPRPGEPLSSRVRGGRCRRFAAASRAHAGVVLGHPVAVARVLMTVGLVRPWPAHARPGQPDPL